MSLTSFLNIADVKAKLKLLRPNLPRKIGTPLKVEPRSNRYAMVGTAFDYLLRFELQRRAPHAVTEPWGAEEVPDLIWRETSPGCGAGLDLLEHAFPDSFPSPEEIKKRERKFIKDVRAEFYAYLDLSLPTEELGKRADKILEDAIAGIAAYAELERPNRSQRADFAAHIIRLTELLPLVPQLEEFVKVEELVKEAVAATCSNYARRRKRPSRIEEFAKDAVAEIDSRLDAYPDGYLPPREVKKRAERIVEEAKAAVAAYVQLKKPNRGQQADLAAHAIRLARLDSVKRGASRLDPRFEEADPEDVEDLLALLTVVPFDALLHDKVLLLNPHFRQISEVVGGADADLITGDMLVDFKTTKRSEMQTRDLDQLLGYYLLARRMRQVDPTFPVINRLALYFCRHGHLWVADATAWTDNPRFSEVEEWFFKRAKEVFRCA